MKTISKFALVLILITGTIGCKNNTTPESEAKTAEDASAQMITETPKSVEKIQGMPTISFKMDGELVEGEYPGTYIVFIPARKEASIISKTPKGQFNIIIDNVEGAGTFTIKGNSKNAAGLMMPSKMYEVKKNGTPFTVTIDAVEEIKAIKTDEGKAIRGTFEGKIMDNEGNAIMVTEGKFSSQ